MKTELFTPDELADFVDTLATIRAEISDLKTREDTYKAALIAADQPKINGTLHKVSITQTTPKSINWEAIARACIDPELLPDLIEEHTTTQAPRYTVRISARTVTA